MSLKVNDFCNFLIARNLPDWMVAQLRTNFEENEKSSDTVSAASITTETLAEMGIAHPLHQRRILREVQCFIKSSAAESSLPSAPGSRPKAKLKPREMVYERDTRWPFLDIACVKLKDEPKMEPGTYGHWQRRMALEEKTNAGRGRLRISSKESLTSFGKTKSDVSAAEDGTPTATQEVAADDDDSVSDLSHDSHPSMEWQDWLSSRLHSWGMLSLVDEVLKVAILGNLTELTDLIAQVQAHGTGFAESLEKTPLPPHLAIDFPDAPEDDIAPNTIWTWVTWRLESLERADRRLQKLLDKCGNLVDQVMGYSVSREISIRPPSHSEKKKTINMKKLMLGVSGVSMVSASASSAASDVPSRSASSNIFLEHATSAVRMKNEAKPTALERFRKVAQMILSHIKGKRQDGLVSSTKLLTCVAMQSKVTHLRQDLENLMKEVDAWPHLISENRESCDSMVSRLQQASQSLFHRFVELRQHVEVELREATIGDQGTVETCRLESKIVDVQREMASSLLLGKHALQLAENAGVGLQANGIAEPPNPWEGLVLPEPPWEASFLRALRKLEPLRRNLQFRRQATSITVSSNPSRLRAGSSSRTKFRSMKPGQSIPEEVLAQLLKR